MLGMLRCGAENVNVRSTAGQTNEKAAN